VRRRLGAAVPPDHRPGRPVGGARPRRAVVQALGPSRPVVDHVAARPRTPAIAAVPDRDVAAAAIAAQREDALHPLGPRRRQRARHQGADRRGPAAPCHADEGTRSPDVSDAIDHGPAFRRCRTVWWFLSPATTHRSGCRTAGLRSAAAGYCGLWRRRDPHATQWMSPLPTFRADRPTGDHLLTVAAAGERRGKSDGRQAQRA
jgi:hypothetical protein